MNTIILTTYDYPFGYGEAFLESEVPILAKEFEKIYIIPVRRLWAKTEPASARVLPENVQVLLPYRYGIFLFVHLILNFLSLGKLYTFARKRISFNKRGKGILANIDLFLRHMRWAFVDLETISLYKKCNANIGYAYWKSGCAYPIARLKERGFIDVALSRAHHHDLYPGLFLDGCNPYDTFLMLWLDYVYSISTDGMGVLSRIGYSKKQICISRLGVAEPIANAKRSDDGIVRIISVSRIEPIKRLELLVMALELIPVSFSVQWTHFGGGSQYELVKSLCERLPYNVCADFKGEVPNEVVLSHYANHPVDMLINVSASEGVPVSIMEALSYGVPCIATDVGATREIVNEYNGCLMSRDSSAEEIASAIIKLTERIYANDDLSLNAKKTWSEHFDRDKNFIDFASQICI